MEYREEIYNEVIQEYSELTYFPKRDKFNHHYDDVQNIFLLYIPFYLILFN